MASTKFEYDFYSKRPSDIIREVDANYPKAPPVLRLTKTDDQNIRAEQNSTGRVLYSKTVQFGHTSNFTTTVKFTITPNNDSFPTGDGLAFFIVPEDHDFPPATGGNLGIFSPKKTTAGVFAVALDFFSIEKDRPSLGIDIGSRIPKKYSPVGDDILGKQLTLTVSYDANTGDIHASVGHDETPYQVSFPYKLTQILPSRVSVGLASSTSEAAAIHDVHYWAFASNVQ